MVKKCSLDIAVRTLLGSTGLTSRYRGYVYLQKIITVFYDNPNLKGLSNIVIYSYSVTQHKYIMSVMTYAVKKANRAKTEFFIKMVGEYKGTDWYSCSMSDYIQAAVSWLNRYDLITVYPDVRNSPNLVCYEWNLKKEKTS